MYFSPVKGNAPESCKLLCPLGFVSVTCSDVCRVSPHSQSTLFWGRMFSEFSCVRVASVVLRIQPPFEKNMGDKTRL